MRRLTTLVLVVVTVLASVVVFQAVQRRLTDAAFAFSVHPEILSLLEASREDQRELARLDPEQHELYRERFEHLMMTVQRMQVLTHSRDRLVRRYDTILAVFFALLVLAVVTVFVARSARLQPRLDRLRQALSELARGRTDITVGVRGRDVVGRIATMVEETSRLMARDRRRLATLQNLSAWQEAARRHAHEMRTPLTGARLELARLGDLLQSEELSEGEAIRHAAAGALQELERLGDFTRGFTSFARLPSPRLEAADLGRIVAGFAGTFADAWSNLTLAATSRIGVWARVDGDMLRQVLSNLCDNASQAIGEGEGHVVLSVEREGGAAVVRVADDGNGISPKISERLFEPYATTRSIGEGMGLGLAISKKILLDHDGDLELVSSSSAGTVFRLVLPTIEEPGEVVS